MAFSTSVQPDVQPVPAPKTTPDSDALAPLLSMLVLTIYAGQKSKRKLRRIRRQMAWLLFKEKMRSFFKPALSTRKILIYILIIVILLALLSVSPIAALVLALLALILLLSGSI